MPNNNELNFNMQYDLSSNMIEFDKETYDCSDEKNKMANSFRREKLLKKAFNVLKNNKKLHN